MRVKRRIDRSPPIFCTSAWRTDSTVPSANRQRGERFDVAGSFSRDHLRQVLREGDKVLVAGNESVRS